MNSLNQRIVDAILSQKNPEVRGVFDLYEVTEYLFSESALKALKKACDTGNWSLLEDLEVSKTGETILKFYSFRTGEDVFYYSIMKGITANEVPQVMYLNKAFFYSINEKKQAEIVKQFNQETSFSSKADFLLGTFQVPYYHLLGSPSYQSELLSSLKMYDDSTISEYIGWEFDQLELDQERRKSVRYLLLKDLKEQARRNKKEMKSKEELIQEIKRITDSFISKSTFGKVRDISGYYQFDGIKYPVDHYSYENSRVYSIKPDFEECGSLTQAIKCLNGYNLGQFHAYLDSLVDGSQIEPSKVEKAKLTLEQVALLLRFSGALEGMKDLSVSNQAKILAPLVGFSHNTFYEVLRNVNSKDYLNQNNLEALRDFLASQQEKEIIKDVDRRLKALYK